MESSSKIDNVQNFAEVISDNDSLWSLLLGREVSRFNEEVKYMFRHRNTLQEERGVAYCKKGRVSAVSIRKVPPVLFKIDYGEGFRVQYAKEFFIEDFYRTYLGSWLLS